MSAPYTLLIADDDPLARQLVIRSLQKEPYEIIEARDGHEAQQLFLVHAPDLILSDWMMPGSDGLELLRFVRSRTEVCQPYFILLTVRDRSQDRVAGLDSGADDYLSKPFESEVLRARLNAGTRLLELQARLRNTVAELEQKNSALEADLKAAARSQRALLPHHLPTTEDITFAFRFRPCHYVSGDSLNVFRLTETVIAFYMLDVCGHGVRAVMQAFALHRQLSPALGLHTLLKLPIPEAPYFRVASPAEVLTTLNQEAHLREEEDFFTLFYALLDTDTNTLSYARAGHLPPLLLRGADSNWLMEGGMPLGISETAHYQEGRLQLQEGDRLLVYSDGAVEARSPEGRFFGIEGLLEVARRTDTLESLLDQAESAAQDFSGRAELRDDLSLLGLAIAPSG